MQNTMMMASEVVRIRFMMYSLSTVSMFVIDNSDQLKELLLFFVAHGT